MPVHRDDWIPGCGPNLAKECRNVDRLAVTTPSKPSARVIVGRGPCIHGKPFATSTRHKQSDMATYEARFTNAIKNIFVILSPNRYRALARYLIEVRRILTLN